MGENICKWCYWQGINFQNIQNSSCSSITKKKSKQLNLKEMDRSSLVAQWLRIRLPMQGTWVRVLVREDPTCHGATKPVCHNYWARVPQLLKSACLEPNKYVSYSATREATAMRSLRTATKSSPCSPQLEKAHAQQQRPNAAKNK